MIGNILAKFEKSIERTFFQGNDLWAVPSGGGGGRGQFPPPEI